jgi:hypothetical protein
LVAAVVMAERGGDVVDVGHGTDVDPGLRHRGDDIGEAEAEPLDEDDALVGVGDHFTDQVFAGHAHVDRALRELRGDLGGRQISHLDALEPGDSAAIVACAARLDEVEAGAGEESLRVFLQPALGGHGENERSAHAAPP